MCRALGKSVFLVLFLLILTTAPAGAQQVNLQSDLGSPETLFPDVACTAGPAPICPGDCPVGLSCVPTAAAPGCTCKGPTGPCSACGPGPHFVDICGPFPPIGPDLIANNGVVAGIDLNLDCIEDLTVVLTPCPSPNDILRVDKKQGPLDDSGQFPGTRPLDGHKDVIDTEIMSMCLTGSGVTLSAGTAGPASFPLSGSLGSIAETTSNPSLADSFFDVFFELQGVPGGPLYNISPIRVSSQITCLPPQANYQHPVGLCLPLYTRGVCAGGPNAGNQCISNANCPGGNCVNQQIRARLVTANHSVNQPVCNPQLPFPQCNGNCPAGQFCNASTAGCHCDPIPCTGMSPPQCGGTCPPGQACIGSTAADPCHCAPVPCAQSPFPQCGGPCPAGQACTPNTVTGKCDCAAVPCAQTPFPQCSGACPPGQVCQQTPTDQCTCGPMPCTQSPAPECNGSCPAPLVCDQTTPTSCNCIEPACSQSAFPQCGGPCPPGQICQPDPTGAPACNCGPAPCDQSAPACNGPCPNGLTCTPGAAGGCNCQPVPCNQTPAPTCNGSCPAGQICNVDATGHCSCAPPPCNQSAPMCNGPCPPGQSCLGNAVGGCDCVPGPCSQSQYPQCGGACPSGQVCSQIPGGTSCGCLPVPCEQQPYPQCSGPCPPGNYCYAAPGALGCKCCAAIVPVPVDGVLWTSKTKIIWNPNPSPCPHWYNLYRLDAHVMPDPDDNGVANNYGAPSQCTLPDHTATDGNTPTLGNVFYYQVTEENPSGEGSMGVASNGLPRPNVTPCP